MFNKNKKFYYVLLGLATLASMVFSYACYKSMLVQTWPFVEGVVLSVEAKPSSSVDGKFKLNLKYQYTVDNQTYYGDRFAVVGTSYNSSEIIKLINQYKEHPEIRIYYNVVDPSEAYVDTEFKIGMLFIVFVCYFLVLISILNLRRLYRQKAS